MTAARQDAIEENQVVSALSYEQACAAHRWEVPERYNIAADVCERHPREKLAMIHEDFAGQVREVSWGEIQDDANRVASVLAAHGVRKGDRVAMLLPPRPETAAAFFATWKLGAILLSLSVLYGDEGIKHRLTDSGASVLITNEANAGRIDRSLVEHVLVLDEDLLAAGSSEFETVDTAADDPAQLYYSSGHDGASQGNPARPPLPAGARGVHLLPRHQGGRALPRHGRVGVGGRDLPAARALAARRGAGGLPARGRLRSRASSSTSSPATR